MKFLYDFVCDQTVFERYQNIKKLFSKPKIWRLLPCSSCQVSVMNFRKLGGFLKHMSSGRKSKKKQISFLGTSPPIIFDTSRNFSSIFFHFYTQHPEWNKNVINTKELLFLYPTPQSIMIKRNNDNQVFVMSI